MIYNVVEGDQAAITFQTNVKGDTMFDDLNLLLLGSITTKSVSAGQPSLQCLFLVPLSVYPSFTLYTYRGV